MPRRLQSVASDLVAPPVGYDRGSNPSLADGTGAPRPGGRVAGRAAANQVWWLEANPFPSLPPSLRSAEAALGLERNLVPHHGKAAPGELVRHRLPRHHQLALGFLAFVIDLGARLVTDPHVGRLDEGPGQVLVARAPVALALGAAVREVLRAHQPAVGGMVARRG